MHSADYVGKLGKPFEAFLSNDSGNRSYSFRTPEGPRWIKILDTAHTPVENVQATVEFYNTLKDDLIPRNWRLLEFDDGVAMQHDWVPGKVLKSVEEDPHDPASPFQRFASLPIQKRLSVYGRILQLFVEIAAKGAIIEDFYDGCILYDFENGQSHVCDLDHVHFGPYTLEKERQFGSSRFMAPEEFRKGAIIDQRTNVFTMGATGFVLLNQNKRGRPDWPWTQDTYLVLLKAVSPELSDRHSSIAELQQRWQAVCHQEEAEPPTRRSERPVPIDASLRDVAVNASGG